MLHTLADGSSNNTASVTKKEPGCDIPLLSSSHRPDSIISLPLPSAHDTKIACLVAPMAKVIEDGHIPGEGDLEATEPTLELHPLGPCGAVLPPSSALVTAFSVTTKCIEKLATSCKASLTRRKLAPGVVRLRLRFPSLRPSQLWLHPLPRVGLLWLVKLKSRVLHLVLRLLPCFRVIWAVIVL